MKIACLLGISKYDNCSDLPACKNDVELMKTLLEATDEYEQVLKIDGNRSSSKIKQQIVSFMTQYKGQEIDQVFFYYTGHGDFDGNDFFYVLSDFEDNRKKQTVIENTELDNWLRLLKPKLAIKVVDACHAGVQYIKDPDVFQKFLNKTPESFRSCYFLFSSQKDQFSYQDNSLSDFTHSLAKSVTSFQGTEIRFKDMIDSVSDEFTSNSKQTPFFITQATNTELFAAVDTRLRKQISSELQRYAGQSTFTPGKADTQIEATKMSLVERVKADAESYCTKEEVLLTINKVHDYWKDFEYTGEVSKLYKFEYTPLPSIESEVPRIISIGKWLSENDNDYFALPTYREETYEKEIEVPVRRRGLAATIAIASLYNREYETKTVTRTRNVINGYRLTQDIEYPAISITASPKYENLCWYDCHITFVFSKTRIRFFYLFSSFRESNWEQRTRQPEETWRMFATKFKGNDMLESGLDKISESFILHIMAPINSKFGIEKSQKESAESGQQASAPDAKSLGEK